MSLTVAKVRQHWVADEDRPNCAGCQKAFGLTVRRHHCRFCGEVYCDACTRHKLTVKQLRACNRCATRALSRNSDLSFVRSVEAAQRDDATGATPRLRAPSSTVRSPVTAGAPGSRASASMSLGGGSGSSGSSVPHRASTSTSTSSFASAASPAWHGADSSNGNGSDNGNGGDDPSLDPQERLVELVRPTVSKLAALALALVLLSSDLPSFGDSTWGWQLVLLGWLCRTAWWTALYFGCVVLVLMFGVTTGVRVALHGTRVHVRAGEDEDAALERVDRTRRQLLRTNAWQLLGDTLLLLLLRRAKASKASADADSDGAGAGAVSPAVVAAASALLAPQSGRSSVVAAATAHLSPAPPLPTPSLRAMAAPFDPLPAAAAAEAGAGSGAAASAVVDEKQPPSQVQAQVQAAPQVVLTEREQQWVRESDAAIAEVWALGTSHAGWQVEAHEQALGITVYSRTHKTLMKEYSAKNPPHFTTKAEPKTYKIFKCCCLVAATPRQLYELFADLPLTHTWNKAITKYSVLKPLRPGDARPPHNVIAGVAPGNVDITLCLAAPAAGGVVSARDFVGVRQQQRRRVRVEHDTGAVHVVQDAAAAADDVATADAYVVGGSGVVCHDMAPPNADAIRGWNGPGGFTLLPVAGRERERVCAVTWLLNGDLKGWLPRSVIDSTCKQVMIRWVANVRATMLARFPDQTYRLSPAGDVLLTGPAAAAGAQ